jgi:hypothetical protein
MLADSDLAPPPPVDAGPPPVMDSCVALGTCPFNTWVNVTPKGITIPPEGLRSVVTNPLRPTDLYLGGGAAGIWKSTDYGNTWTMINKGFGYVPQGLCIAILPKQPVTILIGASCVCGKVYKSTDDGVTFRATGGGLASDLYSFEVDPYDSNHIISGLHEHPGIAESNDAGETWHMAATTSLPQVGISWFPRFLDTGDAKTTSKTWYAIAQSGGAGQNGGSPAITHDGGATWTIPTGLQGILHPHGNSQMYQRKSTFFVGGVNGGPGDGVYRSADMGMTFARVSKPSTSAIVWGTPNHVYSMWAWSCFGCPIDPNFMVSDAPGDTWTKPGVPKTMLMGADHVAVTNDGAHYIFVAATRSSGLWRYVEQ